MSEDTPQTDERASVIIDGVKVPAEDLSEMGKVYLARMQRISQKRVIAVVDIEEMDAALRHFETLLINDYQGNLETQEEEEPIDMPYMSEGTTESEESTATETDS
tara:strand:- start:108 stop:422 length:315 start_codon:yes stop_codon:yes gene_type:complete